MKRKAESKGPKKGLCLATLRAHEGTVYSLDVCWKDGRPPTAIQQRPSSRRKSLGNKIQPLSGSDEKILPTDATILLATGSHDQKIILWDLSRMEGDAVNSNEETTNVSIKAEQTRSLAGHTGDVYCLEFRGSNPDEAAASTPHHGRDLPQPSGSTAGTTSAMSARLVSGGDYSLKCWDTSTGQPIKTFSGHTGYVSCLKSSGNRVFTGSWDSTIRSWNLESGRGMHVFKGHKNIVNSLLLTTESIYSASWDTTIIQWGRSSGKITKVFTGHTDGVQCIGYHNEQLLSGSMDRTVRVWNVQTGAIIRVLRGHTGGVECLVVREDLCFTGSYDKTIMCFRYQTGECIATFDGHTDGVYCIKIFDGILFSGSGDRSVRLWDIKELVECRKRPWWYRMFGCC